ncbi:LPP20 family lipoprotein [Fervidobacterium thailandense]|uniref:Uncharacterized protein n=1 Tax=Fervidobacterium thailandense TaxID=1008305 RepID=A0A1E3G5F6_9BACT|nr:LPP20 family lipoprotein [Fervidobacterium thailandense]ODN31380.1 hypothetical protein A4H02_01060 [Fervidobacterium thailandense]
MEKLLLILAAVAVVGLAVFFLMPKPSEKWIEADGVKIWKLPDSADNIQIDGSKTASVKRLAQSNRLLLFVGETVWSGTPQDREVAKLRAYQQLAEFLEAKVSTFAQLVEGQLSSVQISGQKQNELKSVSLSAYKRITELFANAKLQGAYVYASWRVKVDNNYRFYVLLVYDPEETRKFAAQQSEVNEALAELGKWDVDFFKALDAVIDEALKGTPMAPATQPTLSDGKVQQPSPGTPPATGQPKPPVQEPVISQPTFATALRGVGEAFGVTELEAEEKAKKNALLNLSEQLYVDVRTTTKLQELINQVVTGKYFQERSQVIYEKIVETKSEFEFVDVFFRTVEKKVVSNRYYAKVEALVDAENTRATFETYVSVKLAESLLDSRMIFNAKKIVDRYEPLLQKYKFPPRISQEVGLAISRIKSAYADVEKMIKNINSQNVNDKKSALKVAGMINELETYVADLPDGMIDRERLREYSQDIRIEVRGGDEVFLGEQVRLTAKVSDPAVSSLRVYGEKVEVPGIVNLKDGTSEFSCVVKAIDSRTTVSLGGVVTATWTPKRVSVNPDVLRVTFRDERMLGILAGGTTKLPGDTKVLRERATKEALMKIVKKAAAEILIGKDRELLDVPIDEYIVSKVIGAMDYEINASGEYQGLYFVVVDAKIDRQNFENALVDALRRAPTGFALLIVEGDSSGYVESKMVEKLVGAGIKLVSKDFSRKLLEEQKRTGYSLSTLGRLAALSVARYVLYTTVNAPSTYVSDYKTYSVRLLATTQVIDSVTGNIVAAHRFEDVNSGATPEVALSKTVGSQKFAEYVQSIINSLMFENVDIKKVYRYTFNLERATYGSILLDNLRLRLPDLKEVEKVDTKLVVETAAPPEELDRILKSLDTLKIRKIADFSYQVSR